MYYYAKKNYIVEMYVFIIGEDTFKQLLQNIFNLQ